MQDYQLEPTDITIMPQINHDKFTIMQRAEKSTAQF
jgi:hypothetical protein